VRIGRPQQDKVQKNRKAKAPMRRSEKANRAEDKERFEKMLGKIARAKSVGGIALDKIAIRPLKGRSPSVCALPI
jgi:hypothetical protein